MSNGGDVLAGFLTGLTEEGKRRRQQSEEATGKLYQTLFEQQAKQQFPSAGDLATLAILKQLGLTPEDSQQISQPSAMPSLGGLPGGLEVRGLRVGPLSFDKPSTKIGETSKREFSRIAAFEGIFSQMQQLAENVPKGPLAGRAIEAGSRITGGGGLEQFGLSKAVARNAINYVDFRPGIAAGFYRAITGDDRISDLDAAKRALPFVPSLALDPDTFTDRINLLNRAIQIRKQAIQNSSRLGEVFLPGDHQAFLQTLQQARQERPTLSTSSSQSFKEGRLYRDAQGNRATYRNGQFVSVQ